VAPARGAHRINIWQCALAVFVLSAMFVVGWIMLQEPSRAIFDDSVEYLGLARNLHIEHRFVSHYHPGEPELYRTPIYPLMLASLHAWKSLANLRLVMLLQMVMGLATAIGIGLAARLQGSRAPWMIAALYLASPIVLVYMPVIGTEPLYLLLTSYAALLLVLGIRRHSAAALVGSGLVAGLAALVRPIGIVLCLGAVLLLACSLRRPLLRTRAIVWTLSACLLPAAWAVHNGVRTGFWGVSKTSLSYPSSVLGSRYLETGIEPMKTSSYDESGFAAGIADMAGAVKRNPILAARTIAVGIGRTLLGPGEWTLRRALLGEAGYRKPAEIASVYSMEADEQGLRFFRKAVPPGTRDRSLQCWIILAWSILSLLIVYVLGTVGAVSVLRRRDRLGAVWLVAAVSLTLASVGFISNSRFRLPILPFVLLLGASRLRVSEGEGEPSCPRLAGPIN
jgi:4-amino-4-deoxy-L-arabinose transferase-like glycosyltransferase